MKERSVAAINFATQLVIILPIALPFKFLLPIKCFVFSVSDGVVHIFVICGLTNIHRMAPLAFLLILRRSIIFVINKFCDADQITEHN